MTKIWRCDEKRNNRNGKTTALLFLVGARINRANVLARRTTSTEPHRLIPFRRQRNTFSKIFERGMMGNQFKTERFIHKSNAFITERLWNFYSNFDNDGTWELISETPQTRMIFGNFFLVSISLDCMVNKRRTLMLSEVWAIWARSIGRSLGACCWSIWSVIFRYGRGSRCPERYRCCYLTRNSSIRSLSNQGPML